MMNRWPGEAPYVSLGDNISLEYNGKTVNARENIDWPHLRSHKITEIFPNTKMPDVPRNTTISANLQAQNVEQIPASLLGKDLLESQALELPDVYDYHVDKKLAFQGNDLCWASNDVVNYVVGDQITRRLCVRSPIMQLDAVSYQVLLMRTKLGLGAVYNNQVMPILQGDTVHMARNDWRLAVSMTDCTTKLIDLNDEKEFYSHKFAKTSPGGFNRMVWANENQLYYSDLDQTSLIDVRAEQVYAIQGQDGKKKTSTRDIVARGNNVFLLEALSILWYDARMPSRPVLELEHHMRRNDLSLKLDFLADTNKLLLSSSVCPMNIVFSPGTEEGFPVLKQDPYVVELWPGVCIQSQISCRKMDGSYDIWVSTPCGGLYRQTAMYSSPSSPPCLPPDEPPLEGEEVAKDFSFFQKPPNLILRDIANFKKEFEDETTPRVMPTDSQTVPIWRTLGCQDGIEFEEYTNSIWLDQMDQGVQKLRSKYVDMITSDMEASKAIGHVDLTLPLEGVHQNVLDVMQDWPEEVPELSTQADEPSSSIPEFGFTQPEQRQYAVPPAARSSSQPGRVAGGFSFSQPLPKKKKRKTTKVKDGFG